MSDEPLIVGDEPVRGRADFRPRRESLFAFPRDPLMKARAERCQDLVGRTLVRIEVVPLGVMFHFSAKNGDGGVVYWAYGGPKP